MSRWHQKDLFPHGRLDQDLQQVDLRGRNSWRLLLAEVPSVELIEVQLVKRDRAVRAERAAQAAHDAHARSRQHIGNGQPSKPVLPQDQRHTRHPHTNMAKARST